MVNSFLGLDYKSALDDSKGIGWNNLRVTAGLDARAVTEDLQAQIDTLKMMLANHGHIYRTGRGVGHNNEEAETGKAIFFEEMEEVPEFIGELGGDKPLPKRSALYTSAPNPVMSNSIIAYDLPADTHVKIQLYNVRGQSVRTLVDQPMQAGEHRVEFDTKGLAPGVYYYNLRAGEYYESRKLVIAR